MKIIYGLEAFFPHISGVTIGTNKLAMHFGRELGHQTWIITASLDNKFSKTYDPRGYTLIRIPSYKTPIRKNLRVSYFARGYIKKVLREIKPGIIHIQDPAFISRALAIEAKKLGIPVIVTQHSNLSFPVSYLPKFLRKIGAKVYGWSLVSFVNQYCNLMTTPTQTMRKDILTWGVKIPIMAISNGINLHFFNPGQPNNQVIEKYGLKNLLSKPIVLYAGRIDKDKNLETLIKAIPKVLEKCDCYFVFLGKGDIREYLENEVKKLKIEDKVKFMGPILPGDTALPEFYQAAYLFVIPSAIEAQSLVTMEAMASGLPVVAANSGALPELVKDNDNGFLVPPYNSNDFSEAMIKILQDKDLRNKMSARSLEIIAPHAVNLIYEKLLNTYEATAKN